MSSVKTLQRQLLDWFDRHRRVMPWRAQKGKAPDPYHVWLSEIMLQQTTVVAVTPYFKRFIARWPRLADLAAAPLDEVLAVWAGLGYYARARNLHACAQAVLKHGNFPETVEALVQLPGIGPYTAAAISSIAFRHPVAAVDGNVERVISRFFAITTPLPKAKALIRAHAEELACNNPAPGDFTQGLMELGSLVCTPKNPTCDLCPWRKNCAARAQGIAETLPRKAVKARRPVRRGRVYWVTDAKGRFLVEKRDGKGLYAGMYQLPTTAWEARAPKVLPAALKGLTARRLGRATVKHTFSHFDLVLEVWSARAARRRAGGRFVSVAESRSLALPALMRKVVSLCADG